MRHNVEVSHTTLKLLTSSSENNKGPMDEVARISGLITRLHKSNIHRQ